MANETATEVGQAQAYPFLTNVKGTDTSVHGGSFIQAQALPNKPTLQEDLTPTSLF